MWTPWPKKKRIEKLEGKVNELTEEVFAISNLTAGSAIEEKLETIEKQMYFNKDNKLSSKFSDMQLQINKLQGKVNRLQQVTHMLQQMNYHNVSDMIKLLKKADIKGEREDEQVDTDRESN